jgi:hypothetical protein
VGVPVIPATAATHGPTRKVTGTCPDPYGSLHTREVLECGHYGKIAFHGPGKSRRCWDCLTPEQKVEANRLRGW